MIKPVPAIYDEPLNASEAWPTAPSLIVLRLVTPRTEQRESARQQARLVLKNALASLLRRDPAALQFEDQPATPIQLRGASHIGLSISHAPGLSLVAIHRNGPVGIDVQRIALPPDWPSIARDYLGEACCRKLEKAADLPRAFSQQWACHEAALKCAGTGLIEWSDTIAAMTQRYITGALQSPDGYVAAIAIPA